MGNTTGYTTLFNRGSNGYTALFSNSKGAEGTGTLAFSSSNNTSIAFNGEGTGTLAGIFSSGLSTGGSSGGGCSTSCSYIG